jgi:transposase
VAEATRIRNRLHADLVVLVPGYGLAAANLVAEKHRRTAARLLRRLPGVHAELARDRLSRLGRVSLEVRSLEHRIEALVADHPLRTLPGAGALVTAKLVSEAGDVRRFRSADAFAMLAGVAPIPASSGQVSRMRLNRGGNRQLNRALFSIAFAQVRTYPPAQAFVARKRAEGKSWREAIRALKRHLARVVFRLLSLPVSQVSSSGLDEIGACHPTARFTGARTLRSLGAALGRPENRHTPRVPRGARPPRRRSRGCVSVAPNPRPC